MAAKPGYKCDLCRLAQTAHAESIGGGFVCADGRVAEFTRNQPGSRRSQSFSGDEVMVLDAVLERLRAGRDAVNLIRPTPGRDLAKNVVRMAKRLKSSKP